MGFFGERKLLTPLSRKTVEEILSADAWKRGELTRMPGLGSTVKSVVEEDSAIKTKRRSAPSRQW